MRVPHGVVASHNNNFTKGELQACERKTDELSRPLRLTPTHRRKLRAARGRNTTCAVCSARHQSDKAIYGCFVCGRPHCFTCGKMYENEAQQHRRCNVCIANNRESCGSASDSDEMDMTTQCVYCSICDQNLRECLYCERRHCPASPCGYVINTGRYLVHMCADCHKQALIDSHMQLSTVSPEQAGMTAAVSDIFSHFPQWPTADMIMRQSEVCYLCANQLRPRVQCRRCRCRVCAETCSVAFKLHDSDEHPYVVCQKCWWRKSDWTEELGFNVDDYAIFEAPY